MLHSSKHNYSFRMQINLREAPSCLPIFWLQDDTIYHAIRGQFVFHRIVLNLEFIFRSTTSCGAMFIFKNVCPVMHPKSQEKYVFAEKIGIGRQEPCEWFQLTDGEIFVCTGYGFFPERPATRQHKQPISVV